MNLIHMIIRHERNMDVCYLVRKSIDLGHKHKLKAEIINMGYDKSWFLNESCKITIERKDLNKWHCCLVDGRKYFYGEDKCLRDLEWARLSK
jgi:hypothetical protein